MLVDVKYNPNSDRPYAVLKKVGTGWASLGSYADEMTALSIAEKTSKMPDLPCLIARFENGVKQNACEI